MSTDVTVTRDAVRRVVTTASPATEQIPLILHPTDRLTFTDGTAAPYGANTAATGDGLDLRRGDTVVRIRWGAARPATLRFGSSTYLRDAKQLIHVLRIPHDTGIDVTVTLD
ncbi:hypothetical protein ABZU75_21290 [Streptosporangium sp. NPDC005286]|uniref:hypothetical protein n=1 Tax=Streptosporangium sp. NPDC005286 TaxID=3154463 RepID=UPI0033B7D80A